MGPLRAQKSKTRQVVTQWFNGQDNIRELFGNPQVRRSLGKELASAMLREDPDLVMGLLEGFLTHQQSMAGSTPGNPILRQPDFAPHRGGHLSNRGILEAIDDGRLVIHQPGCAWNPSWRKPMHESGVFLDANSLEIHLGPELHVAPRPSVLQQLLQIFVLNLGCERLRPYLTRYAWNPRFNSPKDMLNRYKTVMLTPDNPTYLMLPGEFVLTHSMEVIGLAAMRQPEFGDKPLLAMDVGGLSFWDRAERPIISAVRVSIRIEDLGAIPMKPNWKEHFL